MGWRILQATAFTLVIWANIAGQFTDNPMLAVVMGVFAAIGVTLLANKLLYWLALLLEWKRRHHSGNQSLL